MNNNIHKFKAFTLVEVIVVMVIIAILAALMVPSLTKYIDKANYQSLISESKAVFTAAQAAASEEYAHGIKFSAGKTPVGYDIPKVDEDGNVVLDSKGKVVYEQIHCGRITNWTLNRIQKGSTSGLNVNSSEYKIGKMTLDYLDSAETKGSNVYDFTSSEVRLSDSSKGTTTADGFFKESKSDVGMSIYFDAKGKIVMVHYAKRGCDKIAVVTANKVDLVDEIISSR